MNPIEKHYAIKELKELVKLGETQGFPLLVDSAKDLIHVLRHTNSNLAIVVNEWRVTLAMQLYGIGLGGDKE